ncbi:MAG: ATP-binding protein [Eubacteriales bacterium]|nr:ATP-binding protein [Eubacteriales bacterium]
MTEVMPDIPRIYTALAEWAACVLYMIQLPGRVYGWKRWGIAAAFLGLQSLFLVATGDLAIGFWLVCMLAAVFLMYLFIRTETSVSRIAAGYCCIRAFVFAEFAASLEWEVHCFFWPAGKPGIAWQIGLLLVIYGAAFLLMHVLERKFSNREMKPEISPQDFGAALIIGISAFAISNLSFVLVNTPFSVSYGNSIFVIRTMVDLGGVAILFAHHVQCYDLQVRRELEAVQNVLQNQYLQYQQSRESIELINRKYHDLKHQIAFLRTETDEKLRNAYLDEMEADIQNYEAQNKTGNSVLDTVLTSKSLYCSRHQITLTCVADGSLLDFMKVMDICTIFGNALDNTIEYVETIAEPEKRLIHVSVFSQQGFVMLRFENYCESELEFEEDLPKSTKKDAAFHGYGLKSIRHVARTYGGTVTIRHENNWFELNVLIPEPRK